MQAIIKIAYNWSLKYDARPVAEMRDSCQRYLNPFLMGSQSGSKKNTACTSFVAYYPKLSNRNGNTFFSTNNRYIS